MARPIFILIKLLLPVILAFTVVFRVSAKDPYRPVISNPVLEPWQWTEFHELDTITVSCMSRGNNDGFWLGSGSQAIFFDGYKLESFQVDSSWLYSMAHERSQNLLVSTSKGLYRYIDNQFQKLLAISFSNRYEFITDQNGYVWIGSQHGLLKITPWHVRCFNPHGIFELDSEGNITNKVASFSDLGTVVKNIREIQFPVYRIHADDNDIFWVACKFKDFEIAEIRNLQNVFTKSDWKYHQVDLIPAEAISGIYRKGEELLVTSASPSISMQILNLKTEKSSSVNLSNIGGDDLHTGIVKTSDSKIWIGGHSKIYTLSNEGWKLYQYPEVKLPLSSINIYSDLNDRIYIWGTGMFRELEYMQGSYRTYQDLNFQCNTPDGRYWFTTNNGTVVEADSLLNVFSGYNTSDGLMDMAMQVYYSKKGQLWAAGSHNGRAAIATFDGQRWSMEHLPPLQFGISYDGIKELGDTSIVFSFNGVLISYSHDSGGFIEYHYGSRKWRRHHPPQVPLRIPSIEQTSDGKLWFSGGTVSVFDGTKTYQLDSLFNESRWTDDIAISPDDKIWIAQGGYGLFHFDGKVWQRFGVRNGLASNMVTNLYYENDESLLIATDNGISCFDGKQFVSQIMHPSIGIPREKGTIRLSADKNIWINQGSREWYLYDLKNTREIPREISKAIRYKRDLHGPETYITFAENEIPPEGNVLIRFEGKDFMHKTSPDKLQFSYRLNEGEWSLFSSDKSALLLDLEDGKYIFEVRARDMDLNTDETPAMVNFVVEPPVHKRAWFILTILTFLGIISFLLTRLYMRNKKIHELDQFKLRLFTDISHELKTPLTLIMLPLQKLLDRENKNEETKKYIDLIHENVERLSTLVHQVIDFRRLESKKIQMEYAPGDVIRQINSIFHYYKPLADEKGFNFLLTTETDELWLNYDADKLEKIIVNLLSNAFKYTPENGLVELQVQWNSASEKLTVMVSDNGPGIPAEMQKIIFDRFYRMKNNQHNKIPGSGIGLSLVKELVGLHGGTIEVFSDGENGTEFKVILPLEKAEKTFSPAPIISEETLSGENNEKPLLLIIEDEQQMLEFVSGELSVYFEVLPATTAEKGMELLSQMPDLVISDVMLPGMNGIEFCQRIKESEETSHIPVILLTARDTEENIVQGISMGADDYITKPFNMNELKARCLGMIENRKRLRKRFAENKQIKAEHFTSNKGDQSFLNKAMEIVFQNLDNAEFDVPQFCNLMNMSKTLLYSKLKTLTGQSATEFVRNIRLKESRQILLDPKNELSVSEVSYKVGFNDPLYFSRCFKKYFGIPPSEISKK
ncbi:MAG TPA: hypothetical protein DIW50_10670 [Prolixibacteraceae bacterium]|nr:hypothetical protein [Prolixibacteraceae bacterium]